MRFRKTALAGVVVVATEPCRDERGFFERRFCSKEFAAAGLPIEIRQVNRSVSYEAGTLRGLHYQENPMQECKIVQCLRGALFDVAVDLRPGSATYGRWYGEILDEKNGFLLVIPKGCAHGFQTLVAETEICYFTDQFYSREHERTIHFADPDLAIVWPRVVTTISEKDRAAKFLCRNTPQASELVVNNGEKR